MKDIVLLIENLLVFIFGFGALFMVPILLTSGYIVKSWKYLKKKREEYFPDDLHVRFIDFIIYILSLKWMNKTQWICLAANALMLLYHCLLLNDVRAALILQSTAFLMELAIAPAFEDIVRTIDYLIERNGVTKWHVIKDMYKKYTPIFIVFFVTTYFARLITLWQFSDEWGLHLTSQEVGTGMQNMSIFTACAGWLVALNVITSSKQKNAWIRNAMIKTMTAGREWYAFWNPMNGN